MVPVSGYVVRVWNRDDDQADRLIGPFRSADAADRLEARIEARLGDTDFAVTVIPVSSPDGIMADLEADGWFAE